METTHNSVKVKVGIKVMKGGKSDWLGSHCWSRVRMSYNIRERETSLLCKCYADFIEMEDATEYNSLLLCDYCKDIVPQWQVMDLLKP